MSELAKALQERRIEADITQEALAERLGVTQQYVSGTERGKYTPSWRYLRAFAAAVPGTNLVDLLRTAGLMDDRAIALEQEMAALVEQVPAFADIFEFARDYPDQLPEVVRYARYLVAGAPEEEEEPRAAPQPRRRTATADTT